MSWAPFRLLSRIRQATAFKMTWTGANSVQLCDHLRKFSTLCAQVPSAPSRRPAPKRSGPCARNFGGHVDDAQLLEFALEIYAELHGASARPPRDFIVPSDDESWPHILRGFALGMHASRGLGNDALNASAEKDSVVRESQPKIAPKPSATEIRK